MTAKEAYKIILKENPGKVAIGCLEFADFYAFNLREKGFENADVGGGFDTVNKNTGKTGCFLPQQDFEAYFAAKEIDINTIK